MTSIELINLTLNEIRRSAQKLAEAEDDYRRIICDMEQERSDTENPEWLKKSADILHGNLERCRLALRDVLGDIAECEKKGGQDA